MCTEDDKWEQNGDTRKRKRFKAHHRRSALANITEDCRMKTLCGKQDEDTIPALDEDKGLLEELKATIPVGDVRTGEQEDEPEVQLTEHPIVVCGNSRSVQLGTHCKERGGGSICSAWLAALSVQEVWRRQHLPQASALSLQGVWRW